MGAVVVMDQKLTAYRLDRKSKYCFYLRTFFDLIDVALVNSHNVNAKLGNDISLQNFKTGVGKALIGRYSNSKRSFPTIRSNRQKCDEPSIPREAPTHMPELQEKEMRYYYYRNEGSDHKPFVSYQICGLYLCLTKERNCFLKCHL